MSDPKSRLLKNMFSNYTATIISILIAFFLSPFLIHSLGKAEYGIWALALTVIGFMSLLDAGMKQTLAKFFPKYYSVKDYEGLNKTYNSSFIIYFITSLITVAITLAIAFFFINAFNVSDAQYDLLQTTIIIVGINLAITFAFIPGTSLGPFHRYDIFNTIDISEKVIRTLVIVYFVSAGYGVIAMSFILLSFNLLKLITCRYYQQRIVPELKFNLKLINKNSIKELFDYSKISFLIVLTWVIVYSTDNIIIGIFLSTTMVTYYSIALTLINNLRTLVNAISIPLVPAISHIDATSEKTEVYGLYSRLSKALIFLCTGIAVGIYIYIDKFIFLWMGPNFDITVNIVYILIGPISLYLPQVIANSILLGVGKHKSILYISSSEALSKIILSLILVNYIGIYGVALGTAIPLVIIYAFVYPPVFHKVIEADIKSFYKTSIITILQSIIISLPVGYMMKLAPLPNTWLGFLVQVGVTASVTLIGLWYLGLDDDIRNKLLKKLKR